MPTSKEYPPVDAENGKECELCGGYFGDRGCWMKDDYPDYYKECISHQFRTHWFPLEKRHKAEEAARIKERSEKIIKDFKNSVTFEQLAGLLISDAERGCVFDIKDDWPRWEKLIDGVKELEDEIFRTNYQDLASLKAGNVIASIINLLHPMGLSIGGCLADTCVENPRIELLPGKQLLIEGE